MIEKLGYRKVMLRSNGEPAILGPKGAIRIESDLEIALEQVPVRDHQANG